MPAVSQLDGCILPLINNLHDWTPWLNTAYLNDGLKIIQYSEWSDMRGFVSQTGFTLMRCKRLCPLQHCDWWITLSSRTSRPTLSWPRSWESSPSLETNLPVPAAKEMTFWPWWMVCDMSPRQKCPGGVGGGAQCIVSSRLYCRL